MKTSIEDIYAIQHKLDSLRKTESAASLSLFRLAAEKLSDAAKREFDVYDSDKFFDSD